MDAGTFVALLRGINVGGKNMLPMKALVQMFAAAGCKDVRTYIQSGNVIFHATPRVADRLSAVIAARIEKEFGYRTPVVIRTREQLAEVADNNPFLAAGAAENSLHVLFLADAPGPSRIASLDPDRSPPDAFLVRGREVFLHLPNGAARTKLTNAYFDAKLATTSTGRNWRTVNMILGMMVSQQLARKQAEA
jgi:uncharacterized protein (DUF1697 family)